MFDDVLLFFFHLVLVQIHVVFVHEEITAKQLDVQLTGVLLVTTNRIIPLLVCVKFSTHFAFAVNTGPFYIEGRTRSRAFRPGFHEYFLVFFAFLFQILGIVFRFQFKIGIQCVSVANLFLLFSPRPAYRLCLRIRFRSICILIVIIHIIIDGFFQGKGRTFGDKFVYIFRNVLHR